MTLCLFMLLPYTKIILRLFIILRLYSCPSVTEGQQKRFDLETQGSMSGYGALEARTRQSL